MILPTILPDEYIEGYRGRIALLNGLSSRREIMETLGDFFLNKIGAALPAQQFHLAAAAINNCAAIELVCAHSLISISRGVGGPFAQEITDLDVQKLEYSKTVSRPTRKHLWLCRQCAEKDREIHGFSYWHRDHQIPGLFVCNYHAEPLMFAPYRQLINLLPSQTERLSTVASPCMIKAAETTPVKIAVGLFRSIVKENWLLRKSIVTQALTVALVKKIMHTGGFGTQNNLESMIDKEIPAAWLKDVFLNEEAVSNLRKWCADMNQFTQSGRNSVICVGVVASVLFEDAAEAIMALKINKK